MKKYLTMILTGITVFGMAILFVILPQESYSFSERRVLTKQPVISSETILSGKFMRSFEDYLLDHFPFRDEFRSLKKDVTYHLFNKNNNNDYYVKDGYIGKLEYPLKNEQIYRSLEKINAVYTKYLNDDMNIYCSLIPDKNKYLADLTMDYDAFEEIYREGVSFANYISIYDELSIDDYYYSDQHWKQECLIPVANKLLLNMQKDEVSDYDVNRVDTLFYGTYSGQSSVTEIVDKIYYLENENTKNCIVTSYNTGKAEPSYLYDMDKAYGRDPYEMYLSGSDALIVIENPNCKTDDELIVFRDSFGSSLIPLMVEKYVRITVVDLRYIQIGMLGNYIEFNNQDILFLYSTLVLNNGL